MSFTCKNGPVHQHSTVTESKICWGLIAPPAPVAAPAKSWQTPRATQRQLDYVRDLGGDIKFASSLSVERCSKYIDNLKAKKATAPVERRAVVTDPRLDMVKALLPRVPSGYYAVQKQAGDAIKFIRISRPKVRANVRSNRFAGATKIQTQHGPRLEEAGALWPSGSWSIWDHFLPDALLLLVSDHHTAARRYAKEIGNCMRCNADLTDDRSRHYGIGPECEQKDGWEWAIEIVDEEHGASYEQLKARGLINLSS